MSPSSAEISVDGGGEVTHAQESTLFSGIATTGGKRVTARNVANFERATAKNVATLMESVDSERPVSVDLYLGTGTAAAKYQLVTHPRVIVIGVDREMDETVVRNNLPAEVQDRFIYIKCDVRDVTVATLQTALDQHWSKASLRNLIHGHASPSCVGMSDADQYHTHRGANGIDPKSALAMEDDASLEHCLALLSQLVRLAPRALVTVENPVNGVFPYLGCVRQLLISRRWQMVTTSYCKCADSKLDGGFWPQKNTNLLIYGVKKGFCLSMCNADCEHLIPGTKRHRIVLCSGARVHPAQYVLRDPLDKGLIPHGLIQACMQANAEWKKEAPREPSIQLTQEETVKLRKEAHLSMKQRRALHNRATETVSEALCASAEWLHEVLPAAIDDDSVLVEEGDGEDDMDWCESNLGSDDYLSEDPECIHPSLSAAAMPHGESAMWAGWIAAQEKGEMFDLTKLRPGELLFADEITFDHFRTKGQRQSMLFVYDVKTAGVRVRSECHKVEHGAKFREIALQEGWNKRGHKVTVGSDGCGSMAHLRSAALELGIDHFYLPPRSPRLNPAEQAVGRFKSTVAAVLQAACMSDGPINESYVQYAAEYVSYVHERVAHQRTALGKSVSPYELNVGKPPRLDRLVPFGSAGYAFVPEELRRERGWGKSVRSEPVLMLGYQHMYSRVYKCLTMHGTIVHTEKVQWHLKQQKGVFLLREASAGVAGTLLPLPKPLFKPADSEDAVPSRAPKSGLAKAAITSLLPAEPQYLLIRRNTLKSSAIAYLRARVEALDGQCAADAFGRWFIDRRGELKQYRLADLLYDLSTGWITLEVCPHDVSSKAVREVCVAEVLAETLKAIHRLEAVDAREVLFAMKDLPWKKYLKGKEAPAIIAAHEKELSALLNTKLRGADGVLRPVLEELSPSHPEYHIAVSKSAKGIPRATKCRELLEYKRSNVWKARVCIQGFREDKEALDGIGFNYSSHVVGLASVRSALMRTHPPGHTVMQVDIATAFLQSDPFSPADPARYLYLRDPVSGIGRYFRQWGVVYGACSSPVRFMNTLHPWIVSQGFVAGLNEPCVFYNADLDILVETYVDDCLAVGPAKNVQAFMKDMAIRFKCKDPVELTEGSPIDHLGMNFIKTSDGIYLSMESYIETMLHNLDLDPTTFRRVRTPISMPIEDSRQLDRDGEKFFRSGVGMIGWLAFTGRPDLKYCHSRISQHMANPTVGAMAALSHALRYCYFTKDLGLFQPVGKGCSLAEMRFYCDSDQSGNKESQNKRRSQLGSIAVLGDCPLTWGSKATAVQFQEEEYTAAVSAAVSDITGGIPVCHANITELHADMSSAAAEVYAASIALSEFLHLTFILDEMGLGLISPIVLEVDNSTAIAFADDSGKRSKMRHIDCRQRWVQALRDHSLVTLQKVDTNDNLADLFTKILGPLKFEDLRNRIMWRCPSTSGNFLEEVQADKPSTKIRKSILPEEAENAAQGMFGSELPGTGQ